MKSGYEHLQILIELRAQALKIRPVGTIQNGTFGTKARLLGRASEVCVSDVSPGACASWRTRP